MISKRLKELREERKLLQKDIALILNITTSAYGFYETGQNQPDIDNLKKMSEFFDVSVDYLIGASNIRKPSKVKEFNTLSSDAISEINNFIDYVKNKYKKD